MGDIGLTGFGKLLGGIALLYWGLAIGLLYWAWFKSKTPLRKWIWVGVVVLAFSYLPIRGIIKSHLARKAYQERYAKADALFKAHCKKAGVKIHRTVDGVEGVYLMKVRTSFNTENQYAMDDPFGIDETGDDYIQSFIGGIDKFNHINPMAATRPGYKYVEANDPADGKLKRFTGRIEQPWLTNKKIWKEYYRVFVMDREAIAQRTARYGVTYDDLSTKEDRDYWIAGSSLRVIDLETNEVIAERIGYMMDPAQGVGIKSGRQAWSYAARNACPEFPLINDRSADTYNQTRLFVEKVLKIKEE